MSQRHEREIEEILKRAGPLPTGRGFGPRLSDAMRDALDRARFTFQGYGPGARRLILWGIGLVVASLVLMRVLQMLGGVLLVAGIVMIGIGYLATLSHQHSVERRQRNWRGQTIELKSDRDPWSTRLRRRLRCR